MMNHDPMTLEQALRFALEQEHRTVWIVCQTAADQREAALFLRGHLRHYGIAANLGRGNRAVLKESRSFIEFKSLAAGTQSFVGATPPDLALFFDCYPDAHYRRELQLRTRARPNAVFASLGWSS